VRRRIEKFWMRRSWLLSVLLMISAGAQASSGSLEEGFRLSQTCAGCHGTAGASPGNTIPIIGGQTANYLGDSMRAYKDDERQFYVMNIIAKAFSDSEIDAIAEWFASQKWVNTLTEVRAAEGGELTAACVECHGPSGKGTDLGPRIAGQPATYMIKVLGEYKSGSRKNIGALQMAIVATLSDRDLETLAHHYAGLR